MNLNIQKIETNEPTNMTELQLNFSSLKGEEASRLAEKRMRNSFKKLYHHNSKRMLQILGYQPS